MEPEKTQARYNQNSRMYSQEISLRKALNISGLAKRMIAAVLLGMMSLPAAAAVQVADATFGPVLVSSNLVEVRLADGTTSDTWPADGTAIRGYTLESAYGPFSYDADKDLTFSTSGVTLTKSNTTFTVIPPSAARITYITFALPSTTISSNTVTLLTPRKVLFTKSSNAKYILDIKTNPIMGSFSLKVTNKTTYSQIHLKFDVLEELPEIEPFAKPAGGSVVFDWTTAKELPAGTTVYGVFYDVATQPDEETVKGYASPNVSTAQSLPASGTPEYGVTYVWPKDTPLTFAAPTLAKTYAEATDCAPSPVTYVWSNGETSVGIEALPSDAAPLAWTLHAIDGTRIASWTAATEEIPVEVASGLHGLYLLTAPGSAPRKILLP